MLLLLFVVVVVLDYDPCFEDPCQYNGDCVTMPGDSYFCDCFPGFEGSNCQCKRAVGIHIGTGEHKKGRGGGATACRARRAATAMGSVRLSAKERRGRRAGAVKASASPAVCGNRLLG